VPQEIGQIVRAFRERGSPPEAVLGTLVRVEGSSYRRPGARLLIFPDGSTVGAISGGCLERDLVRRAGAVAVAGGARLVRYDTALDEEGGPGASLGCGGSVEILIEPLSDPQAAEGMRLLDRAEQRRDPAVLAVVIASDSAGSLGTRVLLDQLGRRLAGASSPEWLRVVEGEALRALETRRSRTVSLGARPRALTVFLEFVKPAQELVIFGAGADAAPLAQLAACLGWRVTIVDMRSAHPEPRRGLGDHRMIRCAPSELADRVPIARGGAAVVMTHNFGHDAAVLEFLSAAPLDYLGVLGPRSRTAAILETLPPGLRDAPRLHFPAGLDLGAETAQEVALAIVAEIVANAGGRAGGKLRERDGPIHDATGAEGALRSSAGVSACTLAAP
jgi:xanthine dehydrogenase accessory factor